MLITPTPELLDYYASAGKFTNPDEYAYLYEDLPTDIGELCKIVQNNMLHVFWAERYGRELAESEKQTLNLRKMSEKLLVMQKTLPRPLTRTTISGAPPNW